jgi:3-dehydroquinate dehydratase / shikimate dehydrogenase
VTYLCVPIFARTAEQFRRDALLAAEAGADIIELRADSIEDISAFLGDDAITRISLPVIFTCRPVWEGGQRKWPMAEFVVVEQERQAVLATAAKSGDFRFIDLELETFRQRQGVLDRHDRTKLILSVHDFSGRPPKLYNLITEMNRAACDVNKIAWTPRSIRDNLEVFDVLKQAQRPTIALCMGEAGIISRILAKKFGAFLTYAPLNDESATAPGQVSVRQLKNLYRWDAVTSATKVYGVVAHPVGHSMSPAVHNAAFDAAQHDGVYLPLLVQPGYESFKAFMESFVPFEGLDLCGLSVTLPHKENALRYLQEKGANIEELASRIGAVNTIAIDRPSLALRGINTDYVAILNSITMGLGCVRADLRGMPVAVLGAGGTGRTTVAALADCGAKVTIFNRTAEKALALAEEFAAAAQAMDALASSDCRVFINTTSVGMHPNVDQSLFDGQMPNLRAGQLVFDTIYNPTKTKLLKQAEEAGAGTIGGVEMFVQQAAAQFTLWTGKPAPADVMRQVIEEN